MTIFDTAADYAALKVKFAAGTPPNDLDTVFVEKAGGVKGLGGNFYYDPSDTTSTDDGGTIIVDAAGRRWKRSYNEDFVMASWFGCAGDGVTDDTAAIQDALDTGKSICFADGTYMFSAFTVATPLQSLFGSRAAVLRAIPGTAVTNIDLTGAGSNIVGMTIDGNRAAMTYVYNCAVLDLHGDRTFADGIAIVNAPSMAIRCAYAGRYCGLKGDVYIENCGDIGVFVVDGEDFRSEGTVEVVDFCAENANATPAVTSHAPRSFFNMVRSSLSAPKAHDTLGVEIWVTSEDSVLNCADIDATNMAFGISMAGRNSQLGAGWRVVGGLSYAVEVAHFGITLNAGISLQCQATALGININPLIASDAPDRINIIGFEALNSAWSGSYGVLISGVTNTADHVIFGGGLRISGFANPFVGNACSYVQIDSFDIVTKPGLGGFYGIALDTSRSRIGGGSISVVPGDGRILAGLNLSGSDIRVGAVCIDLDELADFGILIGASVTAANINGATITGAYSSPAYDAANAATNIVQNCVAKNSGSWTLGGSTLAVNNTAI